MLLFLGDYEIGEVEVPEGEPFTQDHLDQAFGLVERYDLRVARVLVNQKDWPGLNTYYAELVFDDSISKVVEIRADKTMLGDNAIWARVLL